MKCWACHKEDKFSKSKQGWVICSCGATTQEKPTGKVSKKIGKIKGTKR